ncbi:MAG: hypothetical protein ACKKMS_03195 [Candidatus Nealsonbacteria bacterium]
MKISLTDKEIVWTKHAKEKMRYYRLSKKRILRVLRHPERKEVGVAPETIAVMQSAGTKKHPTEIWLMYQIVKLKDKSQKLKIITAWRYPGISPLRKPPPIPDDILQDLDYIISSL